MRVKSIRCGICDAWHKYPAPCQFCGAWRFVIDGQVKHVNIHTHLLMGRAIPQQDISEFVMARLVANCIAQYQEATRTTELEAHRALMSYIQKQWKRIARMKAQGMVKHDIYIVLSQELHDQKRNHEQAEYKAENKGNHVLYKVYQG